MSLAVHLVRGPLPPDQLETGRGELNALALAPAPLLTESDLIAYCDSDDGGYSYHRMRLRPAAIARLPREPSPVGTPFVVSAGGERLYLGVFLREHAACSNRIPTILIDPERADAPYDWYWIHRSHPNRLQPGPDPRADPRLRTALRDSQLLQPPESDVWRTPTDPLPGSAGTPPSGVRLRMAGTDLRDQLRGGGRGAFPSVRACATPVNDPEKRPAGWVDLRSGSTWHLPLGPGVYHVSVRIEWRSRTAPPRIPSTIAEVSPGSWSDVVLGS